MFVFPAFDNNFKKRKRTFKCCAHCRLKRVKCELIEDFEVNGCKTCKMYNVVCSLITNPSPVQTASAGSTTPTASTATTTSTPSPSPSVKQSPVKKEKQPTPSRPTNPKNEINNDDEEECLNFTVKRRRTSLAAQTPKRSESLPDHKITLPQNNCNESNVRSTMVTRTRSGSITKGKTKSRLRSKSRSRSKSTKKSQISPGSPSQCKKSRSNSGSLNECTEQKHNKVDSDPSQSNDNKPEDLSSITFVDFEPGEVRFVNTWDSLIKILNLPMTKENGNVEIKKSNSVTTFQATYSKYVGSTDTTALFMSAGAKSNASPTATSPSSVEQRQQRQDQQQEKDQQQQQPQQQKTRRGVSPFEGDIHSVAVAEATGGSIDSESIASSSNPPMSVSSNGSVDSVEFESKLPNYHSFAYKSNGAHKNMKTGMLRDMLGFFVRSNDHAQRNVWNNDAINYGPFNLPPPLYQYLCSMKCFDIGLSKLCQYKLIKLYFTSFSHVLPFLSEESSVTTFKNNHMPTLILYSLILFSCRLEDADKILADDGVFDKDDYCVSLESKIRTMLKFNLDENRLTLLRTHTLLSLYCGGCTGSTGSLEVSSIDLSIAIHHAYSLGIQHHHYSLAPEARTGKKDTTTSKLFWCLFILDRLNALVNSRNCIINRKDSSLSFPIDKSLNGLVQAVIRLEKVIISYQPRGDSRSVPKDIDFDVSAQPILGGGNPGSLSSECLRRLIVNITIMIAQKRKYDALDPSKSNYQSLKSIPDEIYSKSALQILNVTSNYLPHLPVISLIPYCVSYTLSCFVKLDINSIKNETIFGITHDANIDAWTCPTVLAFLNKLKKIYWYASETYNICTEYFKQKRIAEQQQLNDIFGKAGASPVNFNLRTPDSFGFNVDSPSSYGALAGQGMVTGSPFNGNQLFSNNQQDVSSKVQLPPLTQNVPLQLQSGITGSSQQHTNQQHSQQMQQHYLSSRMQPPKGSIPHNDNHQPHTQLPPISSVQPPLTPAQQSLIFSNNVLNSHLMPSMNNSNTFGNNSGSTPTEANAPTPLLAPSPSGTVSGQAPGIAQVSTTSMTSVFTPLSSMPGTNSYGTKNTASTGGISVNNTTGNPLTPFTNSSAGPSGTVGSNSATVTHGNGGAPGLVPTPWLDQGNNNSNNLNLNDNGVENAFKGALNGLPADDESLLCLFNDIPNLQNFFWG
ncbi:unnamed protein product [Ambrosiozyma monospora]|uniref:Unnamed protein product n=1 Tax=Ambrosiozyma monospora TaxID=43982 RepID=A0A9W6YTF4_AMBMO|nr:unnamed protein product [Ambrosiozyma monospora]